MQLFSQINIYSYNIIKKIEVTKLVSTINWDNINTVVKIGLSAVFEIAS